MTLGESTECTVHITHQQFYSLSQLHLVHFSIFNFLPQKDADEFYTELNGKPFNSIESTICYLVYVSRVECMKAFEVSLKAEAQFHSNVKRKILRN